MKILYFFPDTNIFIQCRSLEQLDWSNWDEYDEIHLIVCRPVQRQIDNQKIRGNDRIGRRSRKVHSLFRDLIVSGHDYKVVSETGPIVKLMFDPSCQPDSTLADRLNYQDCDDRIVGCIHSYRSKYPDLDIRLLSHDSGPMATSRMLSIPFVPVPDNWLRPPEPTDSDRDKIRMHEEIARLRNAEPSFSIIPLGNDGNESTIFESEWPSFEALTGKEVAMLVETLGAQFPAATEFGSREPREEKSRDMLSSLLGLKKVFVPATEKEIDEYTVTKYPEWLDECENILRCLHVSLEESREPVIFSFSMANEGSRPGKDVLVTLSAKGNFRIRPPQLNDENAEDVENNEHMEQRLSLPLPPSAPKGRWTTNHSLLTSQQSHRVKLDFQRFTNPMDLPVAPLFNSITQQRDPNEFFYKPERSDLPSQYFFT